MGKFHTYYYPCPICQQVLIGCYDVECEECDRHDAQDDNCIDAPAYDVCGGSIKCTCHPQQITAHLVCQNMELQEEVASLLEELNAVYFKIDNTF
jgi:hypothetical protein